MKILQINSSPTYGGGERHIVDLAQGLASRGHKVHMAVRPSCTWLEKISGIDKESVHRIPLRNATDAISAGKLTGLIRKHGFDIVHAHLARDYPLASMALVPNRSSHLVITRHVLFPLKNIHRLLLRNVSAAIGVSTAVTEKLKRVFPATKVHCVLNGIDVHPSDNPNKASQAFRFEHNIPFDDTIIVTVGELSRLKGQEDLMRAVAKLPDRRNSVRILMVGRDRHRDQRFLVGLKDMGERLGISDRVSFIEWTDDMTGLMAAANIFVSASHTESFGLAILEAMGSRKPVIATATEGALELITDREDGLIVGIGDVAGLAMALDELLTDGEMSRNISAAAQATAKERFGVDRMVDETIAVYKKVSNS